MVMLPELYYAADQRAQEAQKRHSVGLCLQYAILVCASASTLGEELMGSHAAIGSYLFFIVISGVLLTQNFFSASASKWYRLRAVAESIKTLAWKHAMGCSLQGKPSKKNYLGAATNRILDAHSDSAEVASLWSFSVEETSWMMNARSSPIAERYSVYLNMRINEQLEWYAMHSMNMKRRARFFFLALTVTYLIAIGIGIYQFLVPGTQFSWASEPVLVVAAGFLGWTEAKRYGELSTTYSLTAREIGGILNSINLPETEAQFASLVEEVEMAFSREHTQWAAR